MKKLILTFLSLIIMQGIARAELVVLTVDMGELYKNYSSAKEAQDIFNTDVERAQEEMRDIIDQGKKLVTELQELMDKAKNPALTAEARQRYTEEASAKQQEVREKEEAVAKFRAQSDQVLGARRQSMLELHFGEIKAIVEEVAKEKGADIVLNSSTGASVVFSKKELDITSDVLARINDK